MAKHLSIIGMVVMVIGLLHTPGAIAGAGIEPPAGATITGPEIWGEVVINCNADPKYGTARVKRVVDCNTETEAKAGAWPGCPATIADAEGETLPLNTTFFGIPGTAFVNKAKNFKNDAGVVSFDAQFKFWLPANP